jgi:hypothetical protein
MYGRPSAPVSAQTKATIRIAISKLIMLLAYPDPYAQKRL